MPEQRTEGTKIDLERLEKHARSLYLHRFVEAIQQARGEHGRYLTLRAGDELAIRAAADGSDEWLERILVLDDGSSSDGTG
ncbi:MAG: hypothetical protein M3Q18_00085 [Actinomycetota bacterium]|jgi:hypothetical protein|nr:hypothetical protein [Actinomycetota bacterium]